MSDPQDKNQEKPANETFDEKAPWSIDPREIHTEETRKTAEELIDEWVQKIQKDVSEMLKENHVEEFVIAFKHPASEQLVLLSKGSPYDTAVLATDTARTLKTRVLKRLGINA